jgi:hypothetical protein
MLAKLVCAKPGCPAEREVPIVHCGPGKPGADPTKLYCPMSGHTESMESPKHCGEPMKYVEEPAKKKPCCA